MTVRGGRGVGSQGAGGSENDVAEADGGDAPGPTRAPSIKRRRVRPPSDRALEREQEIYEVAAEIFHRKGYAATTLQDIAEAVGLLKGSLYYYIDTKEDLLYRITRTIHESARANIEAARVLEGAPEDRLRTLLELHVMAFGERLSWIRVFYTEHGALGPDRRREIMADRREYEQFMIELIAEGQRSGVFCPELDRVIATNALLTMVNSVYLWYRPGRDYSIASVASNCADLAMGGLRCGPGHRHDSPDGRAAAGAPARRRRRAG